MKVLAFVILHTGKPYLRAAIESIIDQVDHIIILYTPKPSQGFQADIPCPDSRDELLNEVFGQTFPEAMGTTDDGHAWIQGSGGKIVWIEGSWPNETEHVNAIWPMAEGYDWVVRFDADEIFPPGIVAEMILQAAIARSDAADLQQNPPTLFRIPFVHFWKSFSWACRDGSHPFRLFWNPVKADLMKEKTLDSKGERWEVLHFGYAQPTKYITYKMQVSGHRPGDLAGNATQRASRRTRRRSELHRAHL